MWVDAWELSSTHPGYTSLGPTKLKAWMWSEWYEVQFMAARNLPARGGTVRLACTLAAGGHVTPGLT
jgi:hypothetical protein